MQSSNSVRRHVSLYQFDLAHLTCLLVERAYIAIYGLRQDNVRARNTIYDPHQSPIDSQNSERCQIVEKTRGQSAETGVCQRQHFKRLQTVKYPGRDRFQRIVCEVSERFHELSIGGDRRSEVATEKTTKCAHFVTRHLKNILWTVVPAQR